MRRDADNDFVVDDDDECPNASGADRDLDHDGCTDDFAALAAFVRTQIAELTEHAAGDAVVLTRLKSTLRKLGSAAKALDEQKARAAMRGVLASVKALRRAAVLGIDVGNDAGEVAQVARVLGRLQIDQADATPGADPKRLAAAAAAYAQGLQQFDAAQYVEAVESFSVAARQARKAV